MWNCTFKATRISGLSSGSPAALTPALSAKIANSRNCSQALAQQLSPIPRKLYPAKVVPPRIQSTASKLQDTPCLERVHMVSKMKRYLSKSLLPAGLCFALCFDGILFPAFAQTAPAGIEIIVVQGEGAVTSIRQHVTQDPVVQVEDDDHRPIVGAVVVFALPVSGASGEFVNGTKTLTIVTDKNGLAAAHGLKTNEVPGKLQIYVTASYRGLRARGLINQVIQLPEGVKAPTPEVHHAKSGSWKWVLLGIAAGSGAGAAYYFASRNSSTSPVSISTGAVVFGSPR
jgi:hypothetical protein